MKNKNKIFVLAECAMMSALSIAIFTVSEMIPWPTFLHGGSITIFAQVPIIVLSYRRGVKYGLAAAFVIGVVELFFGLANFSYVNTISAYIIVALFDYIVAFGCLGLGGIFRNSKYSHKANITLGAVLVSFLRFSCHFFSGVTAWRDYTKNLTATVIYSFTYNAGYMLPETIITLIGCLAVASILKNNIKIEN